MPKRRFFKRKLLSKWRKAFCFVEARFPPNKMAGSCPNIPSTIKIWLRLLIFTWRFFRWRQLYMPKFRAFDFFNWLGVAPCHASQQWHAQKRKNRKEVVEFQKSRSFATWYDDRIRSWNVFNPKLVPIRDMTRQIPFLCKPLFRNRRADDDTFHEQPADGERHKERRTSKVR